MKRLKMKTLVPLFLAIVMVVTTVGCGSDTPTSDSNETTSPNAEATAATSVESDGEARTIKWFTVRNEWPVMDDLANEYMAENPNITIEFERMPDRSTYNQKLKILASSNALPDMFDSEGDATLEEIASTDALVNMDELFAELNYDRMMPVGLNYARLSDENLYSIAWENNIEYFWYHKDLFAQAGIEAPPETFDELLVDCQKLKDAGITPVACWPGWESIRWLSFVPYRLEGNDYIEKLKVGEAKMSDPTGIQAAEFFQEMSMNYFQEGWTTSDYSTALESFLGSQSAIYYIGTWQFSSFLDENGEIKDDYGYFYLPTIDGAVNGKTDMYAHAGTGTSLNKATFDDDVKDFVEFLLINYPEKAFYDYGIIPPMTFDETLGPISDFQKTVIEDSKNITNAAYCWDVRLDTATTEVMIKELQNLGLGAITPEEFAKRIDASIAENTNK